MSPTETPTERRRILVTAALPYANGHIHIGHLLEYVQTDMWVRFQKLRGHDCLFMCADDTHGTPIMLRARAEGRSEKELIAEMQAAHLRDFSEFEIGFDNYGSTDSPENRELCGQFWQSLLDAEMVVERDIEQLFDPEQQVFLADRFVQGTCPSCGAPVSIRRQLRGLQGGLFGNRVAGPGQHDFESQAGGSHDPAAVCSNRATARFSDRVDSERRPTFRRRSPTT